MVTTTPGPSSTTTASSSVEPTVPTEPRYDLVPATEAVPVVTVLDPGAEPRVVLAYAFEPGDTTTAVMTMAFGTSQTLDGELASQNDLELIMGVETRVLEVSADGFVIETKVTEVQVGSSDARIVDTLENIYAFLPGLSSYVLMGRSGGVLAVDQSQLASLFEASGQVLDFSPAAAAPPFPDEPLGVGGRWVAEVTVVQEFVATLTRTTYEVVALDGSIVELQLSVEQELLNPDALAVGLENAETSFTSEGTGTARLDLTSAMPSESESSVTMRIAIHGVADGTEIDVLTENLIGLSVVTTGIARAG